MGMRTKTVRSKIIKIWIGGRTKTVIIRTNGKMGMITKTRPGNKKGLLELV